MPRTISKDLSMMSSYKQNGQFVLSDIQIVEKYNMTIQKNLLYMSKKRIVSYTNKC